MNWQTSMNKAELKRGGQGDCLAVFSDVHGDLTSLREVWAAIESQGLQNAPVLNCGDTVAYGDEPAECIRFMVEHTNIVSVEGNYDRHVARYHGKRDEYKEKWGKTRPEKLEAIRVASDMIGDMERAWLNELPREVRLCVNGHGILLCHYLPWTKKEGLHMGTPLTRMIEIAARLENVDIVLAGHIHAPFARTIGGVLFVNPGSVGRSAAGPSWAVVRAEAGKAPEAEILTCR